MLLKDRTLSEIKDVGYDVGEVKTALENVEMELDKMCDNLKGKKDKKLKGATPWEMSYKNEDLQNKMSAKLGIMKYQNNGAVNRRLIPMVANEVD